MHAIESKENFSQELIGLMKKINQQVDTYSDAVHTDSNLNTKDAVSKINVLKKFNFLLKPIPDQLKAMSQADWETNKDTLQKTFNEAQNVLNDIVKT